MSKIKKIISYLLIIQISIFIFSSPTYLSAYTKAQINAMKAQYDGIDPSHFDYLIPDGSDDVSPKDKENSLKTLTIKDRKNKVLFIGSLDKSDNLKIFNNVNNYFKKILISKSKIYSSRYNLDTAEVNTFLDKYKNCTNRNYISCTSKIESDANKLTISKENSNKSIIYFCKVIIFFSTIIILIALFGTKKVVIND